MQSSRREPPAGGRFHFPITRLGFLSQPAFAAWDADCVERGFGKRSFCRRGAFLPKSQRKTFTIDEYQPLRSLAAPGFTD
jgi:hypothetical protein